MDFWGFWKGFGRDLDPLGLFLGLLFSCLYLEWSSKVLLEASGLDLGSILKGLGGILGGFGMGFGESFGGFNEKMGAVSRGPHLSVLSAPEQEAQANNN